MEKYSIKDIEKLSGIKAHTIRVWERRFNIVSPQRTETNRRRYRDDDLRRIINISILRRNDFKISDIVKLSPIEIEEKVSFLSKDLFQPDTQIDSMVVLMIEHNEKVLNELLIRSMVNRGLEETMISIVFPFLKRIGVMWQTGSVDIGSEHFITSLFRQKLISSIDVLSPDLKPERKRVIFFLPENELHEIGLLFFHYITKKLGHETLYLGQSTPLSAVARLNDQWKADIIVTGLLSGYRNFDKDGYLALMHKAFPDQTILVAGELAANAIDLKNKHIFPISSVDDLKHHLL
jgi:MerR family transcriptional regulator, light-induced transcriptional regulator